MAEPRPALRRKHEGRLLPISHFLLAALASIRKGEIEVVLTFSLHPRFIGPQHCYRRRSYVCVVDQYLGLRRENVPRRGLTRSVSLTQLPTKRKRIKEKLSQERLRVDTPWTVHTHSLYLFLTGHDT